MKNPPIASRQNSKFILEELEARQLFSGGIEGIIVSETDSQVATYLNIDEKLPNTSNPLDDVSSTAAAESQTHEIVFVDSGIDKYELLVEDLLNNADNNRNIEVVLLDNNRNGIAQITQSLQDRDDLDAIHIISHGSDGSVNLGNTSLNSATLEQNNLQIALWANAFAETGDILIYGCNLAESEVGQSLVSELAALTLTDVAASDDLTGAANLGGDWDLEHIAGAVEVDVALSEEVQQQWSAVLAATAEDSMDYPVGVLAGNGGGTGWVGNWSSGSSMQVVDTGLTHPTGGLDTSGGAIELNAPPFTIPGMQDRDLASPLGTVDETIWASFLLQPDETSDPSNSYMGLTFGTGGLGNTNQLFVGYTGTDFKMNSWGGGGTNIDVAGVVSGETVFLVVKIDILASGNETATLYINPSAGLGSPDAVGSATKSDLDLGTFSTISIAGARAGASNLSLLDQIRIGSSYTDVAPANTAPTASNNTVSTNEDTDYVFIAADFNFSDADAGDTLQQVKITSLPGNGTLKLSGVAVTLDQAISIADIDAGNLVFEPTLNQSGVAYDVFDFKVSDGNSEGPSGTVLHSFVPPAVNSMSGVAFDGTNIWMAKQSNDTIYELDTDGNVLSSFAAPGAGPTGITFDGTNLWVISRDADTVYEIDTSGNVLSSFATPGTDSRGLTWDGSNLWLVEGNGSLIYELTTAGGVVSSFGWPSDYMRDITWDGSSLWVSDQNDQLVRELNTSGTELSSFAAPSTGAAGLAFDGTEFWHADADSDLIYQLASTNSVTYSVSAYTMTIDVTAVNDAPRFTGAPDGNVITDIPDSSETAYGIAVQADGKSVVGGFSWNGSDYDFLVTRYNIDGTLDTSFGGGDGIATVGIGSGDDNAYAMTLQPDGKILLTGISDNGTDKDFALTRLNTDGTADLSFGTAGSVTTDFGGANDYPKSVAVQSDGKIVIAGHANISGTNNFAIARYNSNGTLDTSFDGDGKLTTNVSPGFPSHIHDMTLQADGKIVAIGDYQDGSGSDFAIVRYNTNGSLDTSWDGDGIVITAVGAGSSYAQSVSVQPDGKVVAGGTYNNGTDSDFVVLRYDTNGTLDTSFGGGDGIAGINISSNTDFVQDMVLQADGKIVLSGYSNNGSNNDFAVARLNSDGSIDTSFGGGDGFAVNPTGSANDAAYGMALQADGSILLAGFNYGTYSEFALQRYTSSGDLDTSFGYVNTLDGTPGYTLGGSAVVLDTDVQIYDKELTPTDNFSGASLTLIRNGGANINDVFSATGNLATLTESGNLVLSGVTVGSVTTNSAGTLTLLFNANATQARINETLQSIAYANSGNTPAYVQIDWTFDDGNSGVQGTGGAMQVSGSTTIAITSPLGAQQSLILSTLDDFSNSGAPGLSAWTEGEVLQFSDPTLTFGPGGTNGTLSSVLDLNPYFDSGDVDIAALHYVTTDITVGSGGNTFDLKIGDVLFALDADQTIGATTYYDNDVQVFRPDTPGDYSTGTISLLLDTLSTADTRAITLIEQDTLVGDVTLLAGTFLYSDSNNPSEIRHFEATGVGTGNTTGTKQVFLNATGAFNIASDISGLELIEFETTIGGETLAAGTILASVSASGSIGDNSLAIDDSDIVKLTVTKTIMGSATSEAVASMFMDGSNVALYYNAQDIDALSLTAANDAPVLDGTKSPVLTAINEDAGAPSGAVGSLVSDLVDFASPAGEVDNVTDPDTGASLGVAITAADTSNGTWHYSIDNGATWNALGAVSDANARLLAADNDTRLYFQANANYFGTVANALTFHAWDQTSGTNGGTADLSILNNTVSDNFSSISYTNNVGTQSWTSDWIENDSGGGGASNGWFSISSGVLNTQTHNTGDYIYRQADLSSAVTATLSFSYNNTLNNSSTLLVQVSDNGGGSYTTLPGLTFDMSTNFGSGSKSVDITSYISADTRIRFYVSGSETGGGKYDMYIDNVQISYASDANVGGSTAFSTDTDTASLVVNPVADTPSITNATTNEDTQTTSGLVISPNVADGAEITHYQITAISNGTLYQNDGTTAITNGMFITVAEGAAGLKFTPTDDFNGSGSFTVQASTSNVVGGLGGSPVNASVTVNAVNDVPVATGNTVIASEDVALVIGPGDFSFTDVELDSLASVTITGLNLNGGTLTHTGGSVPVTNGMTITAAQLADLTFTSAFNDSTDSSFTYTVNDAGTGITSAVMNITVNAVNDVPVATGNTVIASEDVALVIGPGDFSFTDVELDSLASVTITGLNLNGGTLTHTGGSVPVTNGMTITAAQLADLTFTSAFNDSTDSSFTYTVNDAGTGITSAVMNITVNAVNDVPVATGNTVIASEDVALVIGPGDFSFTDVELDSLASVTITGLNLNGGTLTHTGGSVPVTNGMTITAAQLADLTFTSAFNDSTDSSFTYTVNDAGTGITSAVMNITVNAVNDVPVATGNTVIASEDVALVIGPGDFSFTDVELDSLASVTITGLNLNGGTLTHTGGSVPVTNGMTITAAQLADLTFTSAFNDSTDSSFTYTVNDAGTGITSAVMNITVNAVNDVPVATGNTVIASEDVPLAIGAGDFNFTDVELDSLASVTITGLNLNGGTLTHTGGTVPVTNGMTITAAQLADLTFTSAFNDSTDSSFTYTVNDAGTGITSAVMNITVNAVNDVPVATGNTVIANEDIALVIGPGDFSFTDVELDSLASVTITGLNLNGGTLTHTGGSVPVTNGMTITAAQLADLTFTSAFNDSTDSSFTYTVNDAGTGITSAVMNITVNAVNDVPVATGNTVIASEDVALVIGPGDFSFTDVELDSLASVTITGLNLNGGTLTHTGGSVPVTNGMIITAAQLADLTFTSAFNDSTDSSFTYTVNDAGTGITSAVMNITVNAVNDVPVATGNTVIASEDVALVIGPGAFSFTDVELDSLASVTITGLNLNGGTLTHTGGSVPVTNGMTITAAQLADLTFTSAFNDSTDSSFTYTVNDAGTGITSAVMNITVNAVNDVPVATGNTVIASEDVALVIGPGDFSFTDVELDSLASVTITGLNLNGGTLTHTGGSVPVTNGMTITAAQLADLTFTSAFNDSTDSSFTYTVNDAGTGITSAVMNITVNAVNDVPVATGNTVIASEDVALVIGPGDFSFTDVELDSLASVTITGLNLNGGTLTHTGGSVPVTNGMTITAAQLADLTFTSAFNDSTDSSFTYTVNDAGTGITSAVMNITVNAVNDVPVATGNTVIASEDVPLVIGPGDFSFTDVELDSLASVTITGLNLNGGTLTHTGGSVPVTNGMTITAAQLADLTFTSAFNDSTDSSFTYTVNDAGTGITSAVMNITVNAVNDVPVIGGSDAGSVTEDVGVIGGNITTNGILTIVDPDTGESTFQAGTITGTYGDLIIDTVGNWSYSADNTQAAIQSLDTGESLTDMLTVSSFDGTTHNIVITLDGTEDVAVIGGTITGSVTEDGTLTSSGTLTIADVDNSDNPVGFTDVTSIPGDNAYGDFVLSSNTWTYTLDNSNIVVQALDVAETLNDTYTFTASDGSTQVVTITINGAEDVATIGGTTLGTVAEDGVFTSSGTLAITDIDSSDNPVSFADITSTPGDNAYGSFVLNNGTWTYTLDNANTTIQALDVGETLNDSIAFIATDGSTRIVTVTINGAEDAPVLNTNIADQTATEGSTFALTLTPSIFADVDTSDILIYTATLSDDSPLPTWLSFDETTLSFSGTPSNADVGAINVKVSADDGSSKSSETITITISNNRPASYESSEALATPVISTTNIDDLSDDETTPEASAINISGQNLGGSANLVTPSTETIIDLEDSTLPDYFNDNQIGQINTIEQAQAADTVVIRSGNGKFKHNPSDSRVQEASRLQALHDQIANQSTLNLYQNSASEIDALEENALWESIDKMHKQMDNEASHNETKQVETEIIVGSTATLTAGFVSWVLRGGALMASMMSSIPLLNRFDPLPILKSRKDDEEVVDDENDETESTHFSPTKKVDKLFSKTTGKR